MLTGMRRYTNPRATLLFVLVATSLMIIVELAIWSVQRPLPTPVIEISPVISEQQEVMGPFAPVVPEKAEIFGPEYHDRSEAHDYTSAQKIVDKMKPAGDLRDQVRLAPQEQKKQPPHETPKEYWKKHAVPAGASKGKARIVIIIDDMGMGHKNSYEVINLNSALTLAFLPYAPGLAEITKDARARGHELLIHAPMEPLGQLNPGPLALLDKMSPQEMTEALDQMFNSFSGYVGINNHMGSRLTQNEAAMNLVMEALAKRGLIFVDSKTIQTSVAARVAAEHGLYYAERDVFLDHQDNITFVRKSLLELESIARKRGSAIAIGHPKAATIQGLKEWLPLAEERGFVVVPVSAVVRRGKGIPNVATASVVPEPQPSAAQYMAPEPSLKIIYGPVLQPSPQP